MLKKLGSRLHTLRVRIVAIAALCWLLPTVVLGGYMSDVFFRALRDKTEQALVSGASHAQTMIIQEIERILKKSKDVTYDEQLSEACAKLHSGLLSADEFFIVSRTYWHKMFQREQSMVFTAFFLVDESDQLIYTTDDVNRLLAFREEALPYIEQVGETLDTRSRFVQVGGRVYHVRNLLNRRLERFGMMVLDINMEQLLAPMLDTQTLWEGRVDILLDEYTHQADPDWPLTEDNFREGLYGADGDMYLGQRIKTSDYTLTYRILLEEDMVLGETRVYYEIILALVLLLLPIEALIMLFIYLNLTRPLLRLSEATQRMAGGELGITVQAGGDDEIGRLGMAFNVMSHRMERLIDKSYREELALRDARISALQSRINPHFLNNALELMNWQARLEGAEKVSQMIAAMSTLLNAALDRTNQRTVPLHTEIEVADAYFFFIEQRFGGRVQIHKDVDPRLLETNVPRLVVQPLLENAVEHGIGPAGGGNIYLHIYRDADTLYIDVRNDGNALTEDDQRKINALLEDTGRETHSEHLGIRNVNLRLKLIYRQQAGLCVLREEFGATLARITIPCEDAVARRLDSV